jgi:starch synthase
MSNDNQFLGNRDALPNILFAASEIQPLIKTGGLADVAGSLPLALHDLGVQVRLVLPAYPSVIDKLIPLQAVTTLKVPGWGGQVRILQGSFKGEIPVYLVDIPGLFDRGGNPYVNAHGHDWADNADRFAAFARSVVAIALGNTDIDWHPDLVHCNDWQTGLVPALLSQHGNRPTTIFTIHNLSYQGVFNYDTFRRLRLPPEFWSHHGLEFHENFSFIKGGLAFADRITTVSPSYSREILTPEFGYGLEGLLNHRQEHLHGIVNGIDDHLWDPATDPYLEHNYSANDLTGKAANKQQLQAQLGLAEDKNAMLLGHIGRTVPQKGTDLILQILPHLLEKGGMQLALLGSGDPQLEAALLDIAAKYPQSIAVHIGYDEALAHRIEAGSDAFLMPSRYEPCGLNQMFSLRYGTPPIVHRTGGLADTVIDASAENVMAETANGFVFDQPNAPALWGAVEHAHEIFRRPPMWWEKLALAGMGQDFSWKNSAQAYLALYREAMESPSHNPLAGP